MRESDGIASRAGPAHNPRRNTIAANRAFRRYAVKRMALAAGVVLGLSGFAPARAQVVDAGGGGVGAGRAALRGEGLLGRLYRPPVPLLRGLRLLPGLRPGWGPRLGHPVLPPPARRALPAALRPARVRPGVHLPDTADRGRGD